MSDPIPILPSAPEVVSGPKVEGVNVQAEIDKLKARAEAAEARAKAREVEASQLQDENARLYAVVKQTAVQQSKSAPRRSWGLLMDE